jgi:hypothetical protein
MISLRLDEDIEKKLNVISESENISKTQIVKDALALYFEKHSSAQKPYELGKELFGRHGSEAGSLSRDYKKVLKAKLLEKHSR